MTTPPVRKQMETLYRAADIAKLLSISRSAAYKLMKEVLPVVRFSSYTLRVRESDLIDYIASRVDHH